MKKSQFSRLTRTVLLAGFSLAASVAPSFGASISFSVSNGTHATDVGTITLSDGVGADTVQVFVDLKPGYGFVNTGSHTPFTFNLVSQANLAVSFLTPAGGAYVGPNSQNYLLSLETNGGSNPSFGTFSAAILSNGHNGNPGAYYGDLKFNVSATGLTLNSFIANAPGGYFFSADLIYQQTGATGAQGWKTPVGNEPPAVPEGGAAVTLLGLALAGLAVTRRFAFKG